MWLCQFIDWLKFETRPSSLLNVGTAYEDPVSCESRLMRCVQEKKNDYLLAVVSLVGLSVVSKANIHSISRFFPCNEV